MGKADATAYTRVLSHTCRCVEIDVWPSSDGPIVTHGWTWSDHIPFRDVCRAIGKAVHPNDWPVMVSLECHVDVHEQDRISHTMRSVWGEKLVEKEVAGLQGHQITPGQLRGKILLMVSNKIYCGRRRSKSVEYRLNIIHRHLQQMLMGTFFIITWVNLRTELSRRSSASVHLLHLWVSMVVVLNLAKGG